MCILNSHLPITSDMMLVRPLVPLLVVFVSLIGLGVLAYPTVPEHTTSTTFATSTPIYTNSEAILAYSYLTVTCTGSVSKACIEQVFPYTMTFVSTLTTTQLIPMYSLYGKRVPLATRGVQGVLATLLILVLLFGGVLMLARGRAGHHNSGLD